MTAFVREDDKRPATDPNAIQIFQGQDFYVPHFEVILRGRNLPRDVIRDITQVSYKDNIKEMDSFEITINNWDAEKRVFKYSDERLFDPGQEIELWMGYYGKDRLRLMLTGEITSLRPTFPAGGMPTLTVGGLNLLHRFRFKQRSAAYLKKTDSEIAEEVGKELSRTAKVEIETVKQPPQPEVRHEYIFQDNQFDVIFLMERARRIGYDLFVKEKGANAKSQPAKLYFGPSVNNNRATYELKYGKSLIQFTPTLTTKDQVSKVTVRGWDAKKKQSIEGTADRNKLRVGAMKKEQERFVEPAFDQREEVIADHPVASKPEAETLARTTLENIVKDMIKGTGSTVGLPDLRAGGVIFIGGLGERFNGRYFVTGTTHAIGDGGYTTQFECRREEVR